MTSTASKSARSNRQMPRPVGPDEEARAAQLHAANINPRTGLATDYLNHFNEAIMLLEMVPAMPECAEDFLGWQPRSYAEHFTASNFKARDLAISAYESADPHIPSLRSAQRSFATTKSCWCGARGRRPGVFIRCRVAGSNSAKRCIPPCTAKSTRRPG